MECYIADDSKLLCTIKKMKTKGILAMYESIPTIGKRFSTYNILNNKINRKKYRSLILQTPDLNKYVSGCILYEETVNQKNVIENLKKQNILVGIKMDEGLQPLNTNEFITNGLHVKIP